MPERLRWPLLARPEMIDELCRELLRQPPRTVLLTGLAGAGKTTLLDELAARLRTRHRRVIEIVGIAELAAVPLGAFLPLLAVASGPDAPVDARLRGLLEQLGRDADRAVLLVDDASFLDEISAAAVYQVIRAFGMPTMLTARSGTSLPAALDRLRHEGSLVEHTMPPLTHDETAVLLARRLGGRPTPELLNTLWARTEGNPLFLRGLVEGGLARASPQLTDHGIDVTIDTVDDIGELADRALRRLDPDELRAAQLLALTGGLDAHELELAGAAPAVRRLHLTGLTALTELGRARLTHPLVSDAAGRSLGDERLERVAEAAALLANGDDTRRLAGVRLLLAAGLTPAAGSLAEAAMTAARAGDHQVCDELARAAIAAGDTDAGLRWTLARSRSLLGRLDEADMAFSEGWGLAQTHEERALGVSHNGEHLAFRRHDLAAALHLADIELPALPMALRTTLEPEVRTWRAIAGVLADGTANVADATAPTAVRVRSAMATVLAESLAGRGALARASATEIATIHREFGAVEPVAAAMVSLEQFFRHLARTDGAAAWAVIERGRSGPLTDAAGIWSYTLGVYCWYDGRLDEGARLAALAVDQLRWRDPTGLLGAATMLRALFAHASGDDEAAAELVAGLVPAQLNEPRAAMLHAEFGASRLAAQGKTSDACALLARVGSGAVDAGYGLVGALTMSFAIRLGEPAAVREGLARAAATADPDHQLLPALRDLASALDELDAAALLSNAAIVAQAGMRATAHDALRHAAGARSLSDDVRRRLNQAADGYGQRLPDAPDAPTARELEVARLAGDRLSNAEIADRLRVSVRTVENHLTRYYAKTGMSRNQLRGTPA